MSDAEIEVVNVYAGRRPPPSSVDPAGFGRLHLAVTEALLEHAAKVGQKPYRFSERYDVAVRIWHKLNPEAAGGSKP